MVIKIRIGRNGKVTDFHSSVVNIKSTFGQFAVLLDSNKEMVPLNIRGEPLEPLNEDEVYIIDLVSERDVKCFEKVS